MVRNCARVRSDEKAMLGARRPAWRWMAWLAAIGLVSLPAVARAVGKRQLEGVINLNTASPDELRLLPGIGPAKVVNIVAYRDKHPFRTVDELVRIKGI